MALEREFSGPFVRIHRNCLVARAAIRGFERGRAMIVPGLLMKLLRLVSAWSPRVIQRFVLSFWARRQRRALSAPPARDEAGSSRS